MIPNEYLTRNNGKIAIVLQVISREGLEPDFELLFSNGFINRVTMGSLVNLYDVMEGE